MNFYILLGTLSNFNCVDTYRAKPKWDKRSTFILLPAQAYSNAYEDNYPLTTLMNNSALLLDLSH